MLDWLRDQVASGDAVAQHGFTHRRVALAPSAAQLARALAGGQRRRVPRPRRRRDRQSAVDTGRRVLKLAGLDPRGFVAPGYAYTRALREQLADAFEWWAIRCWAFTARSPARPAHAGALPRELGLIKRATSPARGPAGAQLSPRLLRLDIHPADFDLPATCRCSTRSCAASGGRAPITYDDLLAS